MSCASATSGSRGPTGRSWVEYTGGNLSARLRTPRLLAQRGGRNDVIQWSHHAWTLPIREVRPDRHVHHCVAGCRQCVGATPDGHRERRMALSRRRRGAHPLVGPGPDQRRQLLGPGSGLDLAGGQLRSQPRLLQPRHADLRRRRRLYRGLAPPAGGGYRSRHRRDALDLPRARDRPPPALAPPGLRQGSGLRRGERPRADLRHQPRLLPLGARCRDGTPARELGQGDSAGGLPAVGRPRPDSAAGGGLGALAGPLRELRPGLRHPARAGHGDQLVAADRRERRGRRPRRAPAELRPDAHRERAGRRDGGRCRDRRGALEVPHDPAAWRVRPRDVAQRRLGVVGRHVDVGAGVRRSGARARLPGDERLDRPELHRPPAGRQPLRRLRPGPRRAHRGAALALPDPPQRPSGTTTCRRRPS